MNRGGVGHANNPQISNRKMNTLLLSTFVNCFFIVNCLVISYQVLPLHPIPVEPGLAKWAGELSNLGTVGIEVQVTCLSIVYQVTID